MKFFIRNIIICLFCSNLLISQELIIGQERVEPGIVFIFEGAIKDIVYPDKFHLSEGKSDIHIEARVNWDKVNIPEGTPPNGFVPYLKINALVTNEKTGVKSFIDLVPHINLIDNFHYARNMSLPGNVDDSYTVEFFINNPSQYDLSFHKDWKDNFSESLISDQDFKYENVSFTEIASLKRR